MKFFFTSRLWVLSLPILFQYCTTTSYQNDMQYFTEIPLKDQKQDSTRIYFPDDLKPERPYIEAGLVRLSERGHLKTRQLVGPLRAKARSLGLDAVIDTRRIENGSRGANVGETLIMGVAEGAVSSVLGMESEGPSAVDSYQTYSHSGLEGIGIKYLDNINNIEKSIKYEKAYFSDKPNELIYHKQFFLNGETKSIDYDDDNAIYIHNNFVEAFSLHHLMNQKANWQYRLYLGKVYRRHYHKTQDWVVKACKFIYDNFESKSGLVKKIIVRYPGQEKKEVLKLYRRWGLVERKEIFIRGALSYKEKLIYDDENRLVERKIFKIKDKKESLWLNVKYGYYQNSELKNYLSQQDKP
ncbi:hypothetical protein QQ020_35570 [Fulvivirgaceae bacterium BMA12]|uniref:Lipoprotein n=1 Tax=Agaribacillus aureus TaxID=3051825 RepID=A0ABT8LLZ8_9BACT|nr:hypothetical protein [Fulvivirgaceae bacterium BMA12]